MNQFFFHKDYLIWANKNVFRILKQDSVTIQDSYIKMQPFKSNEIILGRSESVVIDENGIFKIG